MPKKSLIQKAYKATRKLPAPLNNKVFGRLFGTSVNFAGTAGVEFLEISPERSVLRLQNKRSVQNHLGSVHAVACSLLAESASGSIVGLNLSHNKVALCKSMHVDFTRRAIGDMKAEAFLTEEQIELLNTTPKGEINVRTIVTDGENKEPLEVTMVWAWTKIRKQAK